MSLRIPGQQAPASATLGTIPTGAPRRTELPEIYEAEPGDAMPSMCIVGDSGTGKTYQLGKLIAWLREKLDLATIVLSVESKHQGIARYRPKVLPIGAPVKVPVSEAYPLGLRKSTSTERYHRLIEFRDRLSRGDYREHEGSKVGAIVTDGLTEIGSVVKGYKFDNMPVAGNTGQPNVLRAYGEIGTDLLDFMAGLKEAASDSGKALGMDPIAIVATCVETLKDGKYTPLLPGNIAPDNFAQQFEVVLRLAVESAGPNTTEMQYVAHTMPGEVMLPQMGRWIAKSPEGFPAKIVNPNLGEIFEQVTRHYRGESLTT